MCTDRIATTITTMPRQYRIGAPIPSWDAMTRVTAAVAASIRSAMAPEIN